MSRKSTMAIDPITSVKASTCTHSTHGNRVSPSRMAVAIEVSCNACRNCSNTSCSLNVGDPSPCTDDGNPQGDRGAGDQLRRPLSSGRQLPECLVPSQRDLAG